MSLHRGAAATLLAAASESNAKVTAMQLLLSLSREVRKEKERGRNSVWTRSCVLWLNCVRANPVLKWTRTDTFYGFLRNEKVEAPLGTVRIGASLVPMHLYLV